MTDSQSFVERFNQQNPPHKAHRTRRAQGVHGHVLSGAYLHLEVEDAEKTEAWVEQQNERTATFTGVKTSTKPKAAKPNEVKKSGYTLLKGNKPSGENYKINLSALGLPENAQLSFRSWNAAENKCAIDRRCGNASTGRIGRRCRISGGAGCGRVASAGMACAVDGKRSWSCFLMIP